MCLHAVEKCENVENINTQNDYKTTSKKWTEKKKTDLLFVFCEYMFKFQENKFNII